MDASSMPTHHHALVGCEDVGAYQMVEAIHFIDELHGLRANNARCQN